MVTAVRPLSLMAVNFCVEVKMGGGVEVNKIE